MLVFTGFLLVTIIAAVALGLCLKCKTGGELTGFVVPLLFVMVSTLFLITQYETALKSKGVPLELSELELGRPYELQTDNALLYLRYTSSEKSTKPLAFYTYHTGLYKEDFPKQFILYKDKTGKIRPADAGEEEKPPEAKRQSIGNSE